MTQFMCCFLLWWSAWPALAAPAVALPNAEIAEQLNQLQTKNAIDLAAVEKAMGNAQASQLQVDNVRAEAEALAKELAEHYKTQETARQHLETAHAEAMALESALQRQEMLDKAQSKVDEAMQRIAAAQQQLAHVQSRLQEADAKHQQDLAWLDAIQSAYQGIQEKESLQQADALQQQYLAKAAEYRKALRALKPDAGSDAQWRQRVLEARLLDAEERALLAAREGKLNRVGEQLRQMERSLSLDAERLAETRPTLAVAGMQRELTLTRDLLQQKLHVLQRHELLAPVDKTPPRYQRMALEERELFQALVTELQQQQDAVAMALDAATSLATAMAELEQAHRRALLYKTRQLPDNAAQWAELAKEFLSIPTVAHEHMQRIVQSLAENLPRIPLFNWLIAGLASALWLVGLYRVRMLLRYRLAQTPQNDGHGSFSAQSVRAVLRLLAMNLPSIALFGLVIIDLTLILRLPASVAGLVLGLAGVWLGIKLPINLAWLALAEPSLPAQYQNLALYRQLRHLLIPAGALFSLALLVHLLPFSENLRELHDSLFMLMLAILVFPALQARRQILNSMATAEYQLPAYWLLLARILTLLIPTSIFTVSALGLVGYVNLAWELARQFAWVAVLLAGWLIGRGFLGDGLKLLKNFAMRHSTNYGLLWAQDILPLLHKVALIALALGAGGLLFHVNGWQWRDGIVNHIINMPLFMLGNFEITLYAMVVTVGALVAMAWLANWTRRITYRWIYSGLSDLGVRHSLSVFTQYAVLLAGGLITLRLLGVDLTTMAVFAGALGVGLGFGLQNIANNFVSGLLVLMERPLRTGDVVELSGKVGEITHIGIRSSTLLTWDGQEVIVPNSEVISNAFTNWTRSDSLARTVLMIGISYHDDPHQAIRIIYGVLDALPAVARDEDHKPLATLWEFGDSALILRVHYFINLRAANLIMVRSQVLLAIWQQFGAAGIQIPFPQREIHMYSAPPEAHDPAPVEVFLR